jgi:hypothetical protein
MKCAQCGTENTEDRRFCGECGAMLPQPPQDLPAQTPTERKPYKIKVNLLCLFGAMLAVVSLFLPWTLIQNSYGGDEATIGAFDFDEPLGLRVELPDGLRYSIALFTIGAALSFATSLGGILLLVGSLGFIMTSLGGRVDSYELIPWLGPVIGLLSAGAVMMSFLESVTIGDDSEQETGLASRFLTWRVYR